MMTNRGDYTHIVSCKHFKGYWYAKHDGKCLHTSSVYDDRAGEWVGKPNKCVAGDSVEGCYFEPYYQVKLINKFKGNK